MIYDVVINGRPLNRETDFIIKRDQFQDKIASSLTSTSKAIYLAGPILSGKTNILYQTYIHFKELPDWTCFYFTAEHYSSTVAGKYDQLYDLFYQNEVLRSLAKSRDEIIIKAFAHPDADKLKNILICIDEAQSFCPNSFKLYEKTPQNYQLISNQMSLDADEEVSNRICSQRS